MNFFNTLKVAFRSLARNTMRSFLTMLGIIIGVGAVIAMMAVGQGAQYSIEQQIASLGTNVVMIFPASFAQGGVRMGVGTMSTLTEDDMFEIKNRCPAVDMLTPAIRTNAQIIYSEENWNTSVMGIQPDYFNIRNWELSEGYYFTDADVRSSAKVCLIGKTVSENLFKEGNPVGSIIRIKKLPFKVLGVLDEKGQSAQGADQDDVIIAPYTTVQKKLMGVTTLGIIFASAKTEALIPEAQKQIEELLRIRHKIENGQEDDFIIRTQSEIANTASSATKILTMLLASIASISLIVGGIGIMNIMLVSVTERTREIGIRMSVGARQKDILLQFLVEAIVLCLFGGAIGVGFGVGAAKIVSSFAGWPILVSTQSILLSFIFSAAIGIFFGYYPARKASNLNPIDALRYE
ncbi:MAG: ABC transporter permease [Bacteroidota bacterium]